MTGRVTPGEGGTALVSGNSWEGRLSGVLCSCTGSGTTGTSVLEQRY